MAAAPKGTTGIPKLNINKQASPKAEIKTGVSPKAENKTVVSPRKPAATNSSSKKKGEAVAVYAKKPTNQSPEKEDFSQILVEPKLAQSPKAPAAQQQRPDSRNNTGRLKPPADIRPPNSSRLKFNPPASAKGQPAVSSK